MIDIIAFKDLVATSGYTVELARAKEPDLHEIGSLPIIFVGYATIDSKNPTIPLESTIFNSSGEDLVQGFDVQIISTIVDFKPIWVTVYNTLIGENPIPGEKYRSGFTYAQGGVMGLANGLLWHLDRWKIGFPTVTVI